MSDILVGISVALIIIIVVCIVYSSITIVDTKCMKDDVSKKINTMPSEKAPPRVDPDNQRRIAIYANPFNDGLLHSVSENDLPIIYDFGSNASLFSVKNHISFGEGGADSLGSIDAGNMTIRINMIAPSTKIIKSAVLTGSAPHVFGANGIFDDAVRFAVRGGKMKIIKIE